MFEFNLSMSHKTYRIHLPCLRPETCWALVRVYSVSVFLYSAVHTLHTAITHVIKVLKLKGLNSNGN